MNGVGPHELSDVDVECQACGVTMEARSGGGGTVRYFRCPRCRRWVSSMYAEVLKSGAHFRIRPGAGASVASAVDAAEVPDEPKSDFTEFSEVKSRLERWMSALEEQDPYRILGVSPMDPHEVVKRRYRQLAMQEHPDRSGNIDRMRALNLAYERICAHRERQLEARSSPPLVSALES
jgi:hypothetical protein